MFKIEGCVICLKVKDGNTIDNRVCQNLSTCKCNWLYLYSCSERCRNITSGLYEKLKLTSVIFILCQYVCASKVKYGEPRCFTGWIVLWRGLYFIQILPRISLEISTSALGNGFNFPQTTRCLFYLEKDSIDQNNGFSSSKQCQFITEMAQMDKRNPQKYFASDCI